MSAPNLKTILVVEDEPILRMFAVGILTDAGYTVLEAGTAEEALQVVATGTPLAAVITDIEMPGAIMIEAQWPTIAVILVSGRRLPRPDELPLQAQFLAKPYSMERLVEVVAAAAV